MLIKQQRVRILTKTQIPKLYFFRAGSSLLHLLAMTIEKMQSKETMLMKSIKNLTVILCTLLPVAAFALDIGNIKVHSELYQPFSADVQLTDLIGISAKELHVTPAPASAYYLRGVEFNPMVNQMSFNLIRLNGDPVIRITSTAPVTEPIINFLVQMQWPQGEVIKEVTVLPQIPGQGDEIPLLTATNIDNTATLTDEMTILDEDLNVMKDNVEQLWRNTTNKILLLTQKSTS